MSNAVKTINDHKILLYQYTHTSLPAFLKSAKVVESSLIYIMAEFYQQTAWTNHAENILLLKRLYSEKEQYMTTGHSILFEGLRMILLKNDTPLNEEQVEQMINAMNACIENAIQAVEKTKDELPLVNVELHDELMTY